MTEHNADVLEERWIEFPVGINLGDIIIDHDDIFGDRVNIAARLEGLADPSGICISDDVYRHVRDKVETEFTDLGEQHLKNIAYPVRVYRVLHAISNARVWPTLTLPDGPSIAVLPFQNMSGDPEQEYFADGIVEDIITALSRISGLFVIARNSTFTYKGRAVDLKQVGRELGVRYVLEGSVRKSANHVRITGQLIDTASGVHLWADRFDGILEDVFDLQDEVTRSVVGAIAPKLQQAEIERAQRKPTDSLDAYDYYLRGIADLYQWIKDASREALRLFCKAIELDPNFGSAYGMAARCQCWRQANGWILEQSEKGEAVLLARQAVVRSPGDAAALAGGGFALAYLVNELDVGSSFIDRALVIDPNMAMAWPFSCWVRTWLGQPDVALEHEMRAMRLSPLDPLLGQMQTAALANLCAGRFDEASSLAERAILDLPNWPIALSVAAASSALAGRPFGARTSIVRLHQRNSTLNVSDLTKYFPFRRPEDLARIVEGLRMAGVPG
jgi:adenylate cyclase